MAQYAAVGEDPSGDRALALLLADEDDSEAAAQGRQTKLRPEGGRARGLSRVLTPAAGLAALCVLAVAGLGRWRWGARGAAAAAAAARRQPSNSAESLRLYKTSAFWRPLGGNAAGEGLCSVMWGQCGGEGYVGPTCCEERTACHDKPLDELPSYRQCKPVNATASPTTVGRCAPLWDQCGGKDYDGPTCCEDETKCRDHPLSKLGSYRQCRPGNETAASAAEVVGGLGKNCSKLWGQCGGLGFDGHECCEQGTECQEHPLDKLPSYRQCRPLGQAANASASSSNCSTLWSQCGGLGFSGKTCCEGDSLCTAKPLNALPSYRQCRPPPPPVCEDPEPGSACYNRVMFAKTTQVVQHPEWFQGLTPASSFKEFQELEWMLDKDVSQCRSPPCAPGTCYFVFRWEGCDSINEWTCDKPDDSLAYKCCCEYFHQRVNKTKPQNPSKALANAMQAAEDSAPTLFCTSLCMPGSYEVDLLRAQYASGRMGLFSCTTWSVYSNTTVRLSPQEQYPATLTDILHGTLTGKMLPGINPGDPWTVSNTGIFTKFWKQVVDNPRALAADWVVKVDPDTVFMPERLRALLRTEQPPLSLKDPECGIFLNDCHVGMHGPIEVVSRNALHTYKRRHEECETGAPAEHGQEDWYLRDCFESLGVLKVNAYNLLFEGTWACQERPSSRQPYRPPCFAPQVAFHPFKSIKSWMHCQTEAANHPYALPTAPIDAPPDSSNERHG